MKNTAITPVKKPIKLDVMVFVTGLIMLSFITLIVVNVVTKGIQ